MRAELAVSILARPLGRAHPENKLEDTDGREMFQSSPGLSAGRITYDATTALDDLVFQSSPGLSAGRIRGQSLAFLPFGEVSILARPLGRAHPIRASPT